MSLAVLLTPAFTKPSGDAVEHRDSEIDDDDEQRDLTELIYLPEVLSASRR
jgi:hypothetical protein